MVSGVMGRLLGELGSVPVDRAALLARRFAGTTQADPLWLAGDCYLTEDGHLPWLEPVQFAHERLARFRPSSGPGPVRGDPAFHAELARMVYGAAPPMDRLAAATSAGTEGALRLCMDLFRKTRPDLRVWLPAPGARRHALQLRGLGVPTLAYAYAEADGSRLALGPMLSDLGQCRPGDVMLLQGFGHDPTGLDLPAEIWGALAGICTDTGAVPVVDLSAPGLARAIAKDMDGVQSLLIAVPEAALLLGLGSSFGLDRDRPGALIVQAETPQEACRARLCLDNLVRFDLGVLPDRGARLVCELLHAADLRQVWEDELRAMRMRLTERRAALAEALGKAAPGGDWAGLGGGAGLFALLPLSPHQTDLMWKSHGIQLAEDGRLNISALPARAVERLAAATAECLEAPKTAPLPAPAAEAAEPPPEVAGREAPGDREAS